MYFIVRGVMRRWIDIVESCLLTSSSPSHLPFLHLQWSLLSLHVQYLHSSLQAMQGGLWVSSGATGDEDDELFLLIQDILPDGFLEIPAKGVLAQVR